MKLCKDCNYHKSHDYYGTGSGASDECLCPDFKGEINPVTGKDKENTCFIMRIYEEKCGKEGKTSWRAMHGRVIGKATSDSAVQAARLLRRCASMRKQ